MKCIHCGGRMKTTKENFRHSTLGLSYVILVGVDVSRCSMCGEFEVSIPRMEELYRVLAKTVAEKSERLSPEEIRFLRTHLGWSGADFAEHFDVTPQTISRWERGKQDMGAVAERLLRICALSTEPVEDYSVLKRVAKAKSTKRLVRLTLKKHWRIEEAA